MDAETYPYYSGEVVAEKEVYLPQPKANGRVYISLRNGNYASAEVFVNGISAGKKFVFPAFFDVSEYRGRKYAVSPFRSSRYSVVQRTQMGRAADF